MTPIVTSRIDGGEGSLPMADLALGLEALAAMTTGGRPRYHCEPVGEGVVDLCLVDRGNKTHATRAKAERLGLVYMVHKAARRAIAAEVVCPLTPEEEREAALAVADVFGVDSGGGLDDVLAAVAAANGARRWVIARAANGGEA